MDARLKALLEIRDMLVAEGWASEEIVEQSTRHALISTRRALRPNPLLAVICSAAVATNFILIGANHDLQTAKVGVISVRDLRVARNQAAAFKYGPLFATINGEWAWGDIPEDRSALGLEKRTRATPRIEIGDRCLVQLWLREPDGKNVLRAQSTVFPDRFDRQEFEVRLEDIPFSLNTTEQYLIYLSIARGPVAAVADSGPRSRD